MHVADAVSMHQRAIDDDWNTCRCMSFRRCPDAIGTRLGATADKQGFGSRPPKGSRPNSGKRRSDSPRFTDAVAQLHRGLPQVPNKEFVAVFRGIHRWEDRVWPRHEARAAEFNRMSLKVSFLFCGEVRQNLRLADRNGAPRALLDGERYGVIPGGGGGVDRVVVAPDHQDCGLSSRRYTRLPSSTRVGYRPHTPRRLGDVCASG